MTDQNRNNRLIFLKMWESWNSSLLNFYALCTGTLSPTFRRIVVPSCSGSVVSEELKWRDTPKGIYFFYVHVTVHRNKFLYNKTNKMELISQIYFGMKLYMFRTVPLSIIRSLFTVHSAMVYVLQVCRQLSSRTRMELHFHPRPARKLSTNLYDTYHCWVYSE